MDMCVYVYMCVHAHAYQHVFMSMYVWRCIYVLACGMSIIAQELSTLICEAASLIDLELT